LYNRFYEHEPIRAKREASFGSPRPFSRRLMLAERVRVESDSRSRRSARVKLAATGAGSKLAERPRYRAHRGQAGATARTIQVQSQPQREMHPRGRRAPFGGIAGFGGHNAAFRSQISLDFRAHFAYHIIATVLMPLLPPDLRLCRIGRLSACFLPLRLGACVGRYPIAGNKATLGRRRQIKHPPAPAKRRFSHALP